MYLLKILHYFLGFPPYRTGGLTAYCMDLMHAQEQAGDKVIALWPGKINFLFCKKTSVIRRKTLEGIENYEIINPLPVPLDEGIIDCEHYMKDVNESVYEDFFIKIAPDIIHIHTLMGLHKEFINIAKKLNIRVVYTSHDYFGICPKVTLYRNENVCNEDGECRECIKCNQTALSLKQIKILQSPLYRIAKNSSLVKKLRHAHRSNFYRENQIPDLKLPDEELRKKQNEYKMLRSYYVEMLANIDEIHFNSSISKNVYLTHFTPKNSRVISLTRKDIKDNRNIKQKSDEKLRIIYLATPQTFKGYKVIVDALDSLWEEGFRNFTLKIYSAVKTNKPYMEVKQNGFTRDELPSIFNEADILLAPSIWYETFGFTVLEALSYGVPVIVSDNVGSKDIIGEGGIVVATGDVNQLKQVIKKLDKNKLQHLKNGVSNIKIKTMDEHLREIYKLYTDD